MTEMNGKADDSEGEENTVGSSTKPKSTREIQTQTNVVPTFTLSDIECQTDEEQSPGADSIVSGVPSFDTDERRPSISRRRNFSLSLSPRFNQEFQFTSTEPDQQNRPTREQIYRRKTSMPSRPSDLPLLFGNNKKDKKRRMIDGRNIGDANEVSFEQHTEEVVSSFMEISYERGTRQWVADGELQDLPSPGSVSETPIIPEFQQNNTHPLNPTTTLLARRLVLIADELETRYGPDLEEMARCAVHELIAASVNDTLNKAFDIFQSVATKIFDQGRITWTRIVTLLSFGYRMGLALCRQGVSGFVSMVVQLVTRYILLDPIRQWIVQSGGWFAALKARLTNDDDFRSQLCLYYFWGVAFVAATSIICHHFFSRN